MKKAALIAVCVATYKRPKYLNGLLQSMLSVVTNGFDLHLIVADNDAEETAKAVVAQFERQFSFPVSYVVEQARGIASVRNRLVRESVDLQADYIAFVDDDQIVEPDWLLHLFGTMKEYAADAVAGVYLPTYEDDVPAWARTPHAPGTTRKPTGTSVTSFGTGNVLLRLSSTLEIQGPFDERQNLSGGEDTLFSAMFRLRGFKVVWCDESVVYERISRERATTWWRVQRGFRNGGVQAQVTLWTEPNVVKVIERLVRSVATIGYHSVCLLFDIPSGRGAIVHRLFAISRGFGGIVGLVRGGRSLNEYRHVIGQ